MAYRSRYSKRLYRKKKPNILGKLILIIIIIFIAFNWILPNLINGLGFFNKLTKSSSNKTESVGENPTLAPPVLLIPYEATNSGRINISGYASSNSTIKIYVDDEFINEIKTKDDGSFIAEQVSLNLGTNNIYGKTVDTKGLESLSSKILKLIYDNEKPNLSVLEPEDNEISKDKKIKVSGKTDTGVILYVSNERTITGSDGSFSKDISLSEGDNILIIKAHDSAGNLTEIQRKVIYQP